MKGKNSKPVILVVDDEDTVREFVRASLQSQDLDVMVARDGESAFKLMDETLPDLILLDIMLPNMDGFSMCRKIRSNPAMAYIPVIFITAYAERDSLKKAADAGAQGFIEKPILAEELQKQVQDGLKGHFLMPKSLKKFPG